MVANEPVADGQAEPGPGAGRLGGEERVEYLLMAFLRNSDAAVAEGYGD